ncbi:phosphatidic acid phosphatase [Acidovorax carolinensis]|uniref:Phosphatidic acid phosphatase n=2 Tax=Acidovorax carolinensis TaxID=553814 RepID=A0A240U785_9BURK|nr:phosphatidic acid phosphatase [Acidovorax carolinensis]
MVPPMPHSSLHPALPPSSPRTNLAWTIGTLMCLLAWDALGQDRALAHAFGSGNGFPLREQWFFVQVLHEGARRTAWLFLLLLTLGVWWPMGLLRRIDLGERLQLAVSALVALFVVSSLKSLSATSCPWDLAEFGGVARYASHWALGIVDGGGGRCFPAGHASAGFAFLGGYFALRRRQPRAARLWLAASLAAGLILGGAQQVRGAHFMSHTLWTGWLCWTTGWLCDLAAGLLRQRFAFVDSQLPPDPPPHATT